LLANKAKADSEAALARAKTDSEKQAAAKSMSEAKAAVAKAKADAEAANKAKAEADAAKAKAKAESNARAEAEARAKADEARRKAEADAKSEAESRAKAEEAKRKAEAEAKSKVAVTAPMPAAPPSVDMAPIYQQGVSLEASGSILDAIKLYKIAANANYVPAMKKLGDIYGKGIGDTVPRDYVASIKWYNKAKQAGAEIDSNIKR
jgi:TPR repeat protein